MVLTMVHFLDRRIRELADIKKTLQRPTGSIANLKKFWKPRTTPVSMPLATVYRGDYSSVIPTLLGSPDGQICLMGATSTGKSTYGLLDLFVSRERKVLLVQPNSSNIGNTLAEFNDRMQTYVHNNPGVYPRVPFCHQIDLLKTADFYMPEELYVTTVENFVDYISKYESCPHFTTIVIDEYHISENKMVEGTGMMWAMDHHCELICASATPPGQPVATTFPEDITVIEVEGFTPTLPPDDLKDTLWDPEDMIEHQGTIVYAMPTNEAALKLEVSLRNLGYTDINVVTDKTTAEEFQAMITHYSIGTIYILTPRVEFGVTIPNLAFFIDSGLTETTVYEDGVVYVKPRVVTEAEHMQRGGRVGRERSGYYIGPKIENYQDADSAGDYYRANMCVRLIAQGVTYAALPYRPAFADGKLKKLTRACAAAACKDLTCSPYINTHRFSSKGVLYSEFGGSDPDFDKDNVQYLKVFMKGSNYFISPVADMMSAAPPDQFLQNRAEALKKSKSMLKHAGVSLDLAQCVQAFSEDPSMFMADLVEALEVATVGWSTEYSIEEDAIRDYKIIFNTPELLAMAAAIDDVTSIYVKEEPPKNGRVLFSVCFDYQGQTSILALPKKFKKKVKSDDPEYFDLVYANEKYAEILAPIVSVAGVMRETEAVTQLDELSEYLEKSSSWFKKFGM